MTETVVFCTSAKADRRLLNHFNDVCGERELHPQPGRGPIPPLFISARERKMIRGDDEFSQTEPDIFDAWSDQRCADFFEEHHEHENWIDHGIFATLDERSVKDNTVVIHARKPLEKEWESWRVKFEDAYTMFIGLLYSRIDYDITFTQADRFIVDGVFPVEEAKKITREEYQRQCTEHGQNKHGRAQKPESGMRLTRVGKKHMDMQQPEDVQD